ncbi:Lrp/AsnC family transcriptional regulator [Sporosarcina sp. 179-K 3D1 HS]|uniref:Lrp/AsnC family transcriptional regulator n=1 Tax=Sporosarcina sp. 179-K 3D1 HS TaxID=3232169 RepID=UPI0039A00CDB
MDELDLKLLTLLQMNSRVTVSELSKQLVLSRPSVSERLQRLQERGIIEDFTARVSLPAVGLEILLFIQVSELKRTPHEFEQMIKEELAVIECHRVTGTTNYILKAAVNNMASMSLLIDRLIPYGSLTTSIVLSSPVPYRLIQPESRNTPEETVKS